MEMFLLAASAYEKIMSIKKLGPKRDNETKGTTIYARAEGTDILATRRYYSFELTDKQIWESKLSRVDKDYHFDLEKIISYNLEYKIYQLERIVGNSFMQQSLIGPSPNVDDIRKEIDTIEYYISKASLLKGDTHTIISYGLVDDGCDFIKDSNNVYSSLVKMMYNSATKEIEVKCQLSTKVFNALSDYDDPHLDRGYIAEALNYMMMMLMLDKSEAWQKNQEII